MARVRRVGCKRYERVVSYRNVYSQLEGISYDAHCDESEIANVRKTVDATRPALNDEASTI